MNRSIKFLLLTLIAPLTLSAQDKFQISVEAGQVWQLRNDLQIPNDDAGTRIELDEIDQGPEGFYRLEGYYRPAKNYGFRVLYAPLTLKLSNTPDSSVNFNDRTFSAGSEIDYEFKFNSYRLTWFYAFWGHGDEQFNLGFTGKIRDADTKLSQGSTSTNYDNVGFVPLLYLEYLKPLSDKWSFHFSFDGLAGGPGRAFDFAFKLRRDFDKYGALGAGLRTLEGGADNDKVYSFAFFQYALLEWSIGFGG
ncbi:MAG: hypothetical protein CME64_08485 [Halobacteriovoraceae bacterium]|nr:hypothetical protein [Halobacteriovoraceae bacterium]|tara:strand:+ start:235484 stop:236230 length:747 start_codon:yes stop_codon:yes gene_type:complete